MHKQSWVSKLGTDKKLALAREYTKKLTHFTSDVLELHVCNEVVVYGKTLSAQIPRSYAANAFNLLQSTMLNHEIVLNCALWDYPSENRISIPTVIELVRGSIIRQQLYDETKAQWSKYDEFGLEMAERNRKNLNLVIDQVDLISKSPNLKELKNYRDKNLAHKLKKSRREKNTVVNPPKYGQERELLKHAIDIVEKLYVCVCHTGFDINEDVRKQFKRNADALWEGCEFNIQI